MSDVAYEKAIALLRKVTTPAGFVASAEQTTNYSRVWARDGVICGLAALASEDEELIAAFRATLITLAENQHEVGTIPSNVLVEGSKIEISYGGLAGRVDAVTWFVIGVTQYAFHTGDDTFLNQYIPKIEKCLSLLQAWEFNNKHLLYVPLSGNWADEYITDGYVLYDQLLRLWALKGYHHFAQKESIAEKIVQVTAQIEANYLPRVTGEKFHERAYDSHTFQDFLPCSFSPSGYKTQFDAFANSLALLLNIGAKAFQKHIVKKAVSIASATDLGLLPAFWPPVFDDDEDWHLLKNNYKYEFRNHPYEFHNGGSWPMVNGFFGLALISKSENERASLILQKINSANAVNDFSFYENFNTSTAAPNGVAFCAWSAAATILLDRAIHHNFKFLI
ncbi:MAG: fructofuranosidase/invertase [Flavobacterium sp. BFFFF1]|uniref:amylo-alpha-1,6-glucosidase n=1 Tax=Flavobacterium sp. BFFFF1 TaxID=2015557 RepID=UPI000BC6CF10|nr:glycoside hydrolase 100 family protein [Flavobacterium sp. BFFFF1]OYU82242.1 MAG: fructofuranosidase/invertase [Flavobacterium sp. BFFFF1]